MSNLEEDIKGAKSVLNKHFSTIQYSNHSKIYAFSNENLNGCFDNFDFNNKKCLTVLGSSDQALDMYLRGASEITTFDINILTKYFFYLKKAALLSNLTKEEYIRFFYPNGTPYSYDNDSEYYYEIFSKIITNLSDENLIFWNNLFDSYPPPYISRNLFYADMDSRKIIETNIKYLNGDNYYELRDKIKNMKVNFINTDVLDLPKKISDKYDFIYLSNIMEYFNSITEYKKLIFKLGNNLNIDGNIIVCYFFYMLKYYYSTKRIFTEEEFSFNPIREYKDEAFLQYTKRTTSK